MILRPWLDCDDKKAVQVGDMKVYRTGAGPKCIIWCYDIYGFEVRELIDWRGWDCFVGRKDQTAV